MLVSGMTGKATKRLAVGIAILFMIVRPFCVCLAAAPNLLYPVPIKGKYGFMDSGGRIVIQPRFDHVRLFSEGMAVVAIGDRYGYIDASGRDVIPPKYENADSFSEGLAAVEIGEKWGFIDKSGIFAIKPQFGSRLGGAGSFSEGLAPVLFNGKMGYIDHSGHFVIEPRFGFAEEFSEGLAAVGMVLDKQQDTRPRFGYIDKTGKVVVALQYAGARTFHEGLAIVSNYRIGVKFYPQAVIDHAGSQIIGPLEAGLGDFHEGLALISEHESQNTGFMGKTGKQVIRSQFREFDDKGPTVFSEGLAAVSLPNTLTGYIDGAGRMVIPAHFGIACPFKGGIALVFERGNVGYINRAGDYIWTGPAMPMPGDEEPGCSW